MPATRTAEPTAPTFRRRGTSALRVADVDAVLDELDRMTPEERATLLWRDCYCEPSSI